MRKKHRYNFNATHMDAQRECPVQVLGVAVQGADMSSGWQRSLLRKIPPAGRRQTGNLRRLLMCRREVPAAAATAIPSI